MKRITYKQCEPRVGKNVVVYCAGMRGVPLDLPSNYVRDYMEGADVREKLPRRLAKKRATRILHEWRMNALRWQSRGNVEVAMAVFADKRLTRFKAE